MYLDCSHRFIEDITMVFVQCFEPSLNNKHDFISQWSVLFCRSYTKCANGVPKEVFTSTLNINTNIDGLFTSGLLPAWSGLRSQNTHLQLARPVDGIRRLQPSCSSGRLPVSLIRGTLSIGSEVLSLPEIPRGQGPQALHHLCGRSAQTEHLHSGQPLLRGHTQLWGTMNLKLC